MEASPEDRNEQAWSLLLSQECIRDHPISICRLLCVSHSLLQAVHHHVAGQLQLTVSADQQGKSHMGNHLGPWLSAHAVVLRSLSFSLSGLECSRPEQQQQISHIAAGIQMAAERGLQLKISSLSSNVCGKVLLDILPLMASTLTRLELGPSCTDELQKHLSIAAASSSRPSASPSPSTSPGSDSTVFPTDFLQTAADPAHQQAPAAAAAHAGSAGQTSGIFQSQHTALPCTAALASLPALSHLVLHGYAANTLLPSVQPCTQLRSVTLCNLLCSKAQLLRTMPAQLEVSCSGQQLAVCSASTVPCWSCQCRSTCSREQGLC